MQRFTHLLHLTLCWLPPCWLPISNAPTRAPHLSEAALPTGPQDFQLIKLHRALAAKAGQVNRAGARAAACQHCAVALAALGLQLAPDVGQQRVRVAAHDSGCRGGYGGWVAPAVCSEGSMLACPALCKCGLALPVVQHSMHQEMSPIGVIT